MHRWQWQLQLQSSCNADTLQQLDWRQQGLLVQQVRSGPRLLTRQLRRPRIVQHKQLLVSAACGWLHCNWLLLP
jgi:hypothetical protein